MPRNDPNPPHPALRAWLARANTGSRMRYYELAQQLGYHPAYVYGILGGSEEMTAAFRGRFRDVFGAANTDAAFPEAAEPALEPPKNQEV
jgi:hypothetical protein